MNRFRLQIIIANSREGDVAAIGFPICARMTVKIFFNSIVTEMKDCQTMLPSPDARPMVVRVGCVSDCLCVVSRPQFHNHVHFLMLTSFPIFADCNFTSIVEYEDISSQHPADSSDPGRLAAMAHL